jgi:hypothetical protein
MNTNEHELLKPQSKEHNDPQHSTMNPQRFSIVRAIPPYSGLSRLIGAMPPGRPPLFRDKPRYSALSRAIRDKKNFLGKNEPRMDTNGHERTRIFTTKSRSREETPLT